MTVAAISLKMNKYEQICS